MSLVPLWRGAEGTGVLLRRSVPRRHECGLPTFATKRRATIAARVQRFCCRIAIAVLASDPPKINHRAAANSQPHERPMKQFLTTPDALMTRTVAAASLRPFGTELLS